MPEIPEVVVLYVVLRAVEGEISRSVQSSRRLLQDRSALQHSICTKVFPSSSN